MRTKEMVYHCVVNKIFVLDVSLMLGTKIGTVVYSLWQYSNRTYYCTTPSTRVHRIETLVPWGVNRYAGNPAVCSGVWRSKYVACAREKASNNCVFSSKCAWLGISNGSYLRCCSVYRFSF